MSIALPKVGVRLSTPSESTTATVRALVGAFDLDPVSDDGQGGGLPLVVFGDPFSNLKEVSQHDRVIICPQDPAECGEEVNAFEIVGDLPGASWMKGRTLRLPAPIRLRPLPLQPGSMVIARAKNGPVWVRDWVGETSVDRVAIAPSFAEVSRAQPVLQIVDEHSFPSLLPLMQFLREINGAVRWQSSMKACFMFDDPNLHGSRYGYLKFGRLIEAAREHRYHVSFATVPLDAWFASSRAVAAFRDPASPLSLLIHGNDHVHQELNQEHDDAARLAMLAQALSRIGRLEERTGIRVCRVMAPPHGLCRDRAMRAMAELGFEAASISHGSVRVGCPDMDWPRVMGARPVEIIEGLPIIPRFQFAADSFQRILLAAYMNQPIIPTGHHQDVSEGLGILNRLAGQINGLGPVEWMRMTDIVHALFQWQSVGNSLLIRPLSRAFKVAVPESVSRLQVELPPGAMLDGVRFSIAAKRTGSAREFDPVEGAAVAGGSMVWIQLRCGGSIDVNSVPPPRLKVWPLVRRFACEVRDRAQPLRSRVAGCNRD